MAAQDIAIALQRVTSVLQRRPESGLHDDMPATACWDAGLRFAIDARGTHVLTDMPAEFGGGGAQVTPGWLFRAGLAACTGTCIAIAAAAEGIALERLELRVDSRGDTRGVLGMTGADGQPVSAAPCDLRLRVRIAATGVPPQRLRALVEAGCRRSPVVCAAQQALALGVDIDVEDA